MSSDLMVFGSWVFPAGGVETFRASSLSYPAHTHDEGSMAEAFAAKSTAKKASAVLTKAKSVQRFLRFDVEGEILRVHGVLADDDWSDACARLGALARAASTLGAKGHLSVLSDGKPAGRLVVTAKGATFDESKGALVRDKVGEKELHRLWEAHDQPKKKAKVVSKVKAASKTKDASTTSARDKAIERKWAAAEAKYRATWLKGKPESVIRKRLAEMRGHFDAAMRAVGGKTRKPRKK